MTAVVTMLLMFQGTASAGNSSALECTWDGRVCAQVSASSPQSINWFKGWFQNGTTPMYKPRLAVNLIDVDGNVFMHAEQAWENKMGADIKRDVNQSVTTKMSRVCATLFAVSGPRTACANIKQ